MNQGKNNESGGLFLPGLLLYIVLTFLPGIISESIIDNFYLEMVLTYIIPGIFGLLITIIFKFHIFKNRYTLKSILYAFPAAVFVVINIFYAHGVHFTPEKVILSLCVSFCEELLARALLLNSVKNEFSKSNNPYLPILVSSIIFGLVHLTNIPTLGLAKAIFQVIYTTIIGIIFSFSYTKTENLIGSIFWHFLIDVTGI